MSSTQLLQSFSAACRLEKPLVIEVRKGDDSVTMATLEQPFVLIGRSKPCDVILNDPSISQRHAYLQVLDGRICVIDLGSRTGVRWADGTRKHGWIEDGGEIRIGPFSLTIRISEGEQENSDSLRDPLLQEAAEGCQDLTLEVDRGFGTRDCWPVTRSLTLLGRGADCAIRYADESLASYQSAFVNTPNGTFMLDLRSQKTTRVNSQEVWLAKLRDGDAIRAGALVLMARENASQSPELGLTPLSHTNKAIPVPNDAGSWNGNGHSGQHGSPAVAMAAMMAPFQQVMEQFQQCMVSMASMFTQLQQEQMSLMREQMHQINELSKELRDIRAEGGAFPFAIPVETPATPAAPTAPKPTTPPPKPSQLDASASSQLNSAHDWLTERLGTSRSPG
jgi:pSer/pThr/pTyr-binding forkhead associated (FHA) protein